MKKRYGIKIKYLLAVFYGVYGFSLICGQSESQKQLPSQLPGMGLIKNVAKKTLPTIYKVDSAPVESGIYLKHIIASYNANMKYAIMAWLKKESTHGPSYMKELAYLLGQLDTATTVKQAILFITRATAAFEAMKKETPAYQEETDSWQEQAFCMLLLQCSVPLVNVAREQLLTILDEVHDSLIYWKEQKLAPVKYFFHKSPLKWITGKRQADEIGNNIKKLEKLEHDIRIILGRLIKHVYAFDIMGNVDTSYMWMNSLLSILAGIGNKSAQATNKGRFDKIAAKMSSKLSKVSTLTNKILSKVSSAKKPGHIARNWVKYSAALASLYVARNFYLKHTAEVNEWVSPEALKGYVEQAAGYTKENVLVPIQDTVKAIFVGTTKSSISQEKIGEVNRETLKQTLEELAKPMYKGWWNKEVYGVVEGKPLSEDALKYILAEEAKGNLDPLLDLVTKIDVGLVDLTVNNSIMPLIQIILQYATLLISQGKKVTQEQLSIIEEQFRVVRNLVILSPGIVFAGLGFVGLNKLYQSSIARDYTEIRLALLDINSLFIESEEPLSDYNYGKLVYLLQQLRLEAMRYLTIDDMRDDFIADLAKLESNKFDVKQKRGIIKNMFMKYPFLALNAKSA